MIVSPNDEPVSPTEECSCCEARYHSRAAAADCCVTLSDLFQAAVKHSDTEVCN